MTCDRPFSRRAVLASATALSLTPLGLPGPSARAAAERDVVAGPTARAAPEGDAFDTLRERWRTMMTGGNLDAGEPAYQERIADIDAAAEARWRTFDAGAGRTALWPDLPLTDPKTGNFSKSYGALRTLALAWDTPGTSRHHDTTAAELLVGALGFLHDHAYNETLERQDSNWFWWEIGVPRSLVDTCTLLYDRIPADRLAVWLRPVDRWCPNPDRRISNPTITETGANRTDKAVIVAVRGLLGRDARKLELARDGMSDVAGGGRHSLLAYTEGPGDGFYADGSFLQHECYPYTGAYGSTYLSGVAQLVALLAGSSWQSTDPDLRNVYDIVDRAFVPVVLDGHMMDAVRGRGVSRQNAGAEYVGRQVTETVLLLAQGAPEAYTARWRPLLKGWLTRQTYQPILRGVSLPSIRRAKEILDDAAVPVGERTVGTYVFADMDRIVHRGPDWSYAIALSSRRVGAVESINQENLHGWYTGDGMTYLYTADQAHWGDDYWPTVDAYRLPGTTVDTRLRADLPHSQNYRPPADWAGGAVLDGAFAAAGLDLVPEGVRACVISPVGSARGVWCVRSQGAGAPSWRSHVGVSATRRASVPGAARPAGDMTQALSLRAKKSWFLLDDAVIALGAGITSSDGRTIETIVENRNTHDTHPPLARGGTWAHLQGTAGYTVLDGGRLRVGREERTGTWFAIDQGATTGGDTTPRTRHYTTLWLDHGTNPRGARYAYAVLPGASADRTRRYAARPGVEVLSNSPRTQAMWCGRTRLLAANFWQAAHVRTGDGGVLGSDGPCSVLLRRDARRLRLAVSDPSRTTDAVTLTLPWPVRGVESADTTVTLDVRRRTVTARTAGSRGHTHTAVLVLSRPY
ncbi:polysaccharide lyase 8 family protein [Streptomyces phyllanthi]|uniref:Polysaccharide lyase 8 family protein n=1 Tax=Streptomyces phyllanthi TaxID=1803180 RepID=A0A5N8W2N0_9ACTN|nr:polysaccharide lyase 8 family protein [Streptomyces phyllanthi]MPY41747.1 polysaccharide lyase 8 family protein [Streptomyces phyllanthi]